MKPISFTLKTDGTNEDSSFRFDPDADEISFAGPSDSTADDSYSSGLFPPPPAPPAFQSSIQTQVDRKEKARIFMEKLLLEKKMKKQQEDEERQKLEEETRRKAEKISESLSERRSERKNTEEAPKERIPKSLDDMISSKINSLLSESGFNPIEEKKPDIKDETEKKKQVSYFQFKNK